MTLRPASDDATLSPSAVRTGHPPAVILLIALGVLAFAGAAAVGVMFADLLGRAAPIMVASAVIFVVAVFVCLCWSHARLAVAAAAVLAALACAGACVAAVEAGGRHDDLKRRVFAGRDGVRLVEPDSDEGRRIVGAMLASIAASLGAITALPLAVYLAVQSSRMVRS